MKVFSIALTAGVTQTVGGGNFFMLISTTAPVTLQFYRKSSPTDQAVGVEAGYFMEPSLRNTFDGKWFDSVDITSGSTQTISVAIAEGEGGYNRLAGAISATVTSGSINSTTVQGKFASDSVVLCVNAGFEYVAKIANASVIALRFYNRATNTGTMSLYGVSGTAAADAVIQLAPGQRWDEYYGAIANWYVRGTVAGEKLTVQVITN